jgi:hypothetical protein
MNTYFRTSHKQFCPLTSFTIESVNDYYDNSILKNASDFISINNEGVLSVTDTTKLLSKQRVKITSSTKSIKSD